MSDHDGYDGDDGGSVIGCMKALKIPTVSDVGLGFGPGSVPGGALSNDCSSAVNSLALNAVYHKGDR